LICGTHGLVAGKLALAWLRGELVAGLQARDARDRLADAQDGCPGVK